MKTIVRALGKKVFHIALTTHSLRRYKERIETVSTTKARSALRRILNSITIGPPARGETRFVEFEKGYIVLQGENSEKTWVVVTVIQRTSYLSGVKIVPSLEKLATPTI